MVRGVISTDSQHRVIAPDHVLRSLKRMQFGSLNVHLDERNVFPGLCIIEANAGDFHPSSFGQAASANTISCKPYDSVVGSNCCLVKDATTTQLVHQSLKARQDSMIGFEGNHLTVGLLGLRKECLNRISGVRTAVHEAFLPRHREQTGEVLLIRSRHSESVKICPQSQL